MDKFLVIVRHGDRDYGHDPALNERGIKQIQSLREVIRAFAKKAMKVAGDQSSKRVLFSFSDSARAWQSIRGLSGRDEDIIVTNLFITERRDIQEPVKIVQKVTNLALHYGADVIVIVAHGDMPAVIAEAAHESVTGEKLDRLPSPREACGYIVNMTTGEVTPIRHDDLEKTKPPVPPVREPTRPVMRGAPHPKNQVVVKGGPSKISTRPLDNDDDIPF